MLEVKGGGISIENGVWFSTSASGQKNHIKNPFDQAVASKYALVAYLRNLRPPIADAVVTHGVVFPSIALNDRIGLSGPREIIIDCNDLERVTAAIGRLVQHWNQESALEQAQIERITELLAPTVVVRRTLAEDVRGSQSELVSLTHTQMRALSQLRLIRRAVVLGGAGTGKTLLAREKALRLAREGFRTLLVCYNHLLGKETAEEVASVGGVTAGTFHSLCYEQARAARIAISSEPDQEWWEREAPQMLLEAASANGTSFDAVVVDEGQDFSRRWLEILLALCSGIQDSPFYVLADNHQDLYCRGWWCPEEWPKFMLDINCRNSRQIAKRVCAVYGDEECDVGADGPETAFVQLRWDRGGLDVVQHTVARLLEEERLLPSQIAVLSDSPRLVDELRKLIVGDHSFTSWGRTGIPVETIGRFKGLEADAVVLMISDDILRDPSRIKGLCYVGLSRARSVLIITGSEKVSVLSGLN